MWINPILQDMLRHIFQSCILESNEEILELIQKVCCTAEQLCVCECVRLIYVLPHQKAVWPFCVLYEEQWMSVLCAPAHGYFSCSFFTFFMLNIAALYSWEGGKNGIKYLENQFSSVREK